MEECDNDALPRHNGAQEYSQSMTGTNVILLSHTGLMFKVIDVPLDLHIAHNDPLSFTPQPAPQRPIPHYVSVQTFIGGKLA